MNLPKLAIRNHQFTVTMILLLVMVGVISLMTMPRSEDPMVTPPGSNIVVIYPGASPEDLEELVVDPIEEELNELDDINKLTSTAREGFCTISIEFETGVNMDDKYSEIVQKVNGIRDDLPEDIYDLELDRWTITDVNILQVGLVSEVASYSELEREAELLEDRLKGLPGVKKVETMAIPEREVRVSLDFDQMVQRSISLGEVRQAIMAANANIPGGFVDIGQRRLTVKTSGSFENLDEIRDVVVRSDGGKAVYLKDIAQVAFDHEDNTYLARVNGERAVFVTVKQKERTNVFDVMEGVRAGIEEYQSELPATIEMKTVFDQAESVGRRMGTFFGNLLQGLLLVGVVVFLAANYRTSIIVIMAIPLSILIGLGFVDLSGYGLQQMSIAGLVIALGLLVDNAIVVTENSTRFIGQGRSPREAAIEGTSQVGWAVTSSTLTTVLAFVPLMMLPGIVGDFIRSMPVTVVLTLLASLVVSLSLTPYLSSRFINVKAAAYESPARRQLNRIVGGHYKRVLSFALRRPIVVGLIALVAFVGSLALFPLVGVSFFPKAEKPQVLINIDAPEGTNIAFTDSVTAYVESVLEQRSDIKHWAANVGHSNPRVYYNVFPKSSALNHGQVLVELADDELATLETAVSELRAEFSSYPGAEIFVKEFEQGPPIEAPIAIRVIGESLDLLEDIAADVEEIIRSTEGTINVVNPLATTRSDLKVKINREKAAMLGIPLVEIDRTVRTALAGMAAGSYRDADGEDFDIVLRLPFEDKLTVADFDNIYVASMRGAIIPLSQVATFEMTASPTRINRYNLKRNVIITADVEGAVNTDKATRAIIERLNSYDWPKGYRYYVSGEAESREESFGGVGKAVVAAMIAIFAVLVLQFKSYVQPLIVFAAIPLALIGSILALLITGNTFSFTASVGITSLVGIVVNNSIILVDYANQLRRRGMAVKEALMKAGQTRFVPIILTTLTTIGGLLPLTLGGGTMWAPMGWSIIGGLAVSTLLTLVVVPTLYSVVTRNKPLPQEA